MADFRQMVKQHETISKCIGLAIVLISLVYSRFYLMLVLGSFFAGVVLCRSIFSPDSLLPNLLKWYVRKKEPRKDEELTLLKKICPVCGKENCSRHRPELNIVALQPWTNLKLPEKLDVALEEFLNLVLKEFIYTWYRDLSEDEAFVDEIRSSLRFIVSVLLRRAQKVDIPSIVLNKVIKISTRHLHYYLQVKSKVKDDEDIQTVLLQYYGARLHCASHSRKSELEYLRQVAEKVFPYVLPVQSLNCRSLCSLLKEIVSGAILLPILDKLADPDIVNNLLLIFLDYTPSPVCHDPPSREVTILANFAHPLSKNNSCLHLELADILGNPDALFPFMQFMKAEASVNVLQFYLSVEELNSKILTPELSDKQLADLHQELQNLYKMYCAPEANDRIQFDEEIVSQLRQICEDGPEAVVKLQTTTPLFRAYEHAYCLLEDTFLPLFHQSDDYYQMMCGERVPTKLTRSLSRRALRTADVLTLSRIGNKIKGVFKTTTVEGQKADDEVDFGEETDPNMVTPTAEDGYEPLPTLGAFDLVSEVDAELFMEGTLGHSSMPRFDLGPKHDLSAWRITIHDIVEKPEMDNPKKSYLGFLIEIRRVDVLEDDFEQSSWHVVRKYAEFYVLEQKLTEFHGEFDDCALPSRKSFGTRNREFLYAKLPIFELYLKRLLTIPTLRGSELLYSFLTSQCEFTTSFLADLSLGKIVKTGAMKLVKEKGQHLEPFLQSFLSSTETSKPKPSSKTDSDSDTISISSEKMTSMIFENNANMDLKHTSVSIPAGFHFPVEGAYDAVVYLAEHLYNAPSWFIKVLLAVRILARNTLDAYVDWYFGYKLQKVGQEHRLVRLVHLLRDALFFDTDPPRTDEDKKARRNQALLQLKNYIPKLFVKSVGSENFHKGTETIFSAVQCPKLNKQLTYMLLDELLTDLFPELLSSEEEGQMNGLGCHKRGHKTFVQQSYVIKQD